MELTDRQLEKIREVARTVEYGSVTINISATVKRLDLNVQNRIKEEEPEEEKSLLPRKPAKISRRQEKT